MTYRPWTLHRRTDRRTNALPTIIYGVIETIYRGMDVHSDPPMSWRVTEKHWMMDVRWTLERWNESNLTIRYVVTDGEVREKTTPIGLSVRRQRFD